MTTAGTVQPESLRLKVVKMTLTAALRCHSTLFVFSTGMAVGIVPLVIFPLGGLPIPTMSR